MSDHPCYADLLESAQSELERLSIETSLLQVPSELNGRVAVAHANVTFYRHGDTGKVGFDGMASASPEDTPEHMQFALVAIAETRAKARALRDALGVSSISSDELPRYGSAPKRVVVAAAQTAPVITPEHQTEPQTEPVAAAATGTEDYHSPRELFKMRLVRMGSELKPSVVCSALLNIPADQLEAEHINAALQLPDDVWQTAINACTPADDKEAAPTKRPRKTLLEAKTEFWQAARQHGVAEEDLERVATHLLDGVEPGSSVPGWCKAATASEAQWLAATTLRIKGKD